MTTTGRRQGFMAGGARVESEVRLLQKMLREANDWIGTYR